jgi:hypothetical protein
VPSATFLENVADDQVNREQASEDQLVVAESPAATAVSETSSSVSSSTSVRSSSTSSVRDGSLGIGSLKGDIRHE